MTLADVLETKVALEKDGIPVSANTVLARLGGSKRDIVRHLRQLRTEAQERTPPPVPLVTLPLVGAQEQRIPVPAPERIPPGTDCELAHFRHQYAALAAAAWGTAFNSHEQQALGRLQHEFAQRGAVVRQSLSRARQLRPLVAYEQAQAANVACGTSNAEAYAAQLLRGTTPRATMLASAMRTLTAFVGAQEAARLASNAEEPRWSLLISHAPRHAP